ncbi:F-box/LRR-repeat protein At3g26922-like [Vicia villosa]|uniref:F-box/LRR-repeat protein At3g26922-like n=1 Tax=Vicia villosa TaxID=3911 RepID=UPI00273B3F4B|nr:F-box/LRR-repeat protein At3g26922-like [Vicia villosa]
MSKKPRNNPKVPDLISNLPSKKPRNNRKVPDLISNLSDHILLFIISHLSIKEIVRTSILSKRWTHLWKNVSHFDFELTRMVNADSSRKKKVVTKNDVMKYAQIVNKTLEQHKGDLITFESCKKLKILKLDNIFMEEESIINGILKFCFGLEKFSLINSHGFNSIKIENKSLKSLELIWLDVKEIEVNVEELQNLVIDSIVCPPKSLRIYSQNLRSFCSIPKFGSPKSLTTYPQNRPTLLLICELLIDKKSRDTLKTQDILENCSDLFESQSINIFQNLLTLSIDLDLNNIREALALSYVLKTCNHLNTLNITIQIKKTSTFDDCALLFPKSMFWETREIDYEFFEKLKFVTLKGFSGKEQEVLFAKYLISRAYMMEKMYVICDSTIVKEAKDLLSLSKASRDLSIVLKKERKKE